MKVNANLLVPIEAEQIGDIVQWIIGLAGVYIFGQSVVDAAEKHSGKGGGDGSVTG